MFVDSVWEKLSSPFSLLELEWRVVQLAPDKLSAQVRPQLRLSAVRARLDEVCGVAGWSNTYSGVGQEAVACTLSLSGVSRSAVAARGPQGGLIGASEDAFVYAAELLGLRPPLALPELPWVDYDPEHGNILYEPDISDVGRGGEPDTGRGGGGRALTDDPVQTSPNAEHPSAPPFGVTLGAAYATPHDPPQDPVRRDPSLLDPGRRDTSLQETSLPDTGSRETGLSETGSQESEHLGQSAPKSAGHKAIDRLLERLKAEGLGLQAAKLVVEYGGYGGDPAAARELYAKLRGLLLGRSDEL